MKSQYYAVIEAGEIREVVESTPAKELLPNEIPLSDIEYNLILACRFNLALVETYVESILEKVNTVGKPNEAGEI